MHTRDTQGGIFTGGHISSLQGATARPKSHLDEVKDKNQKRIDEISLALIRGEFEVRSATVTNHLYGLDETKLNVTTHGGRNEVEITIKE
ncbi:hypothetical protein [Bacillus wiedmannii]|uniref:hypothetical protein n=1 Tax=Bacillus wiedmannii TaxID=1890302 RepID=UPI000BF00349|nr:hypothetical protein [Bacillus wiedmannii]PEJ48402.1 hypothetical protein CN672_13745 [Bacillus wiedmannii]PEM10312.1 hypothetical protein CN610_14085 [Bacillus wiedmannii]PGD08235.1 hypothetical protein COM34_14125 [Bacillus wiedmannii]PHD09576.1 hypothetical protein COF45_17940 [Bacillus wiedmannii]